MWTSSSRKIFKPLFCAALFLLPLQISRAQDVFTDHAKHFDYDQQAPLDLKEISVQIRAGATIHDVTYASPKGGKVSAYLVVPQGQGKFAAIIWGHWMLPHSPTANRDEFLQEAVAYAQVGVVSILINTPQLREGFRPDPTRFGSQGPELIAQQVIDLRRAVDLLLSRHDVDPKRIAYVGHSFDAATGAVLDAVDKRPATFVFMGGPQSVRELVLKSDSPRMVALRAKSPIEKIEENLKTYAWADPGNYATHLGPAPALFQYALHDDWVPLQDAKDYFAESAGPKESKFYDSDHALNAEARRDRWVFLREHLALKSLPLEVLDAIPPTK
jgi:cephalosporin-C deacetylase-like acetyl esterase